jgi:hypothetical protein
MIEWLKRKKEKDRIARASTQQFRFGKSTRMGNCKANGVLGADLA